MWISFHLVLKIAEGFIGERIAIFGVDNIALMLISLIDLRMFFDNFCSLKFYQRFVFMTNVKVDWVIQKQFSEIGV